MYSEPTYLVTLSDWGSIELSGPDKRTYLNGQCTIAVTELGPEQASLGAHCDAKGKSWSHFYLLPYAGDLQLFQRKSTIQGSCDELKKYGVFSKVEIEDKSESLFWYALVGPQAQDSIEELTDEPDLSVNDVAVADQYSLAKLAKNVYLFAVENEASLPEQLLQFGTDEQGYFEIALAQAAIPFFSSQHQKAFVPQMLNLHALDGISFKKGCYIGQETIARMRYLGKNKRACFAFTGNAEDNKTLPNIDDTLEVADGERWLRAGTVISIAQEDGQIYGMAVCSADIDPQASLRLKQDSASSYSLLPLPYSLDYEDSNENS